MNLEAKLMLSIYSYKVAKIIQLVYQMSFVLYLYEYREGEITFFTLISNVILIGVLVTFYILYKWGEELFRDNEDNVNYFLIAIDLTNFIVAVINYPIAISAMEVKYKDEGHYYEHHSYGSQEPKVDKISRYPRKLLNETEQQDYIMDNETIKEHIENITEALVDKTINFFGDLFSYVGSKISTSSEIINTSLNEFSEKKISTSHEPSSQLVEDLYKGRNIRSCLEPTKLQDYYYIYVTLSLTVPSIICIIIQGFVLITLLWIECVKYRIWKATSQQQPPVEIPLNDLEKNIH